MSGGSLSETDSLSKNETETSASTVLSARQPHTSVHCRDSRWKDSTAATRYSRAMVDKDTVRRGYDSIAESYTAERSSDERELALLDRFLETLPSDARLLDVGCGGGTPVLRKCCTVGSATGLDFSRTQLELATSNAPQAALLQGDMTSLPIRDDAFDAVTAFHSLIHVPRDEHQSVYDEFERVLRPGGRLLVTTGTGAWSGTNPDWLETGVEMQWDIAGPATTRTQLQRAGFGDISARDVTHDFSDQDEQWLYVTAILDP